MVVKFALIVALFFVLASSASAGSVPTPMLNALDSYGADYATYQGWIFAETEHVRGDSRHASAALHFLSNPAPGAEACYGATISIDDGCPAKWYTGGIEFYMDVQAHIVRCGPGWYVVSTPMDKNKCHEDVGVDFQKLWAQAR